MGILDSLKNLFGKKTEKPAQEAEQAVNAVENAAEEVQDKVEDVKDAVEDKVEDVKDKVGDLVENVKDKLPDLGGFFDSILGKLPIEGELGDQVNEVIGSVRSSAPEGADVRSIGSSIIEALTSKFGLEGEIGEKIKAVIEFIKSKLPL